VVFGKVQSMKNLLRHLDARLPQKNVEAELSKIVEAIVQTYHPDAIFLFGSAERLEVTQSSDFDLLVILENENDAANAWRYTKQIRAVASRPLDLIFRSTQEWKKGFTGGAALVAVEDGMLIYRKS
jgi:predicted nucleotidyltransferase